MRWATRAHGPPPRLDEIGSRMTPRQSYASALLAEEGFYRAFEKSDPAAMMLVWDSASTITCVHPFGPMLIGVEAVAESWRAIFRQQMPCRVEIDRVTVLSSEDFVTHVVRENIIIPVQQRRFAPVFATNIYRRFGAEWRMVLHHASPSPPNGVPGESGDRPPPTRH